MDLMKTIADWERVKVDQEARITEEKTKKESAIAEAKKRASRGIATEILTLKVAAQLSEVQEREIQLREQISSLESERDYEKKSRENAQFQMSCLAKEMDRLRAASAAEIELTNQQRIEIAHEMAKANERMRVAMEQLRRSETLSIGSSSSNAAKESNETQNTISADLEAKSKQFEEQIKNYEEKIAELERKIAEVAIQGPAATADGEGAPTLAEYNAVVTQLHAMDSYAKEMEQVLAQHQSQFDYLIKVAEAPCATCGAARPPMYQPEESV